MMIINTLNAQLGRKQFCFPKSFDMYGLIFPEAKLLGNIKNNFVIYYSNKDNSTFPNLPQRDKQIIESHKISLNFIDYMVLFVFVSLDQHFSAEGLL